MKYADISVTEQHEEPYEGKCFAFVNTLEIDIS
jgi:hypothetical protein